MNFNLILKKTLGEILIYFNEECFKDLKINNKNIKLGSEDLIEKITTDNLDMIDSIIQEVNILRQENQELLTRSNVDHKLYASTEILLSSAFEAFKKVKESFTDLNFLKHSQSDVKLIDLNEKFVIRKLTSNCQRVLNKYENLPSRFLDNLKVEELLNCFKKIIPCENINEIVVLAKEVLIKQDEIKRLDYFIDYNALIDEYGWVHDIVKLSSANAEHMGLIVNVEIFSNVIAQAGLKI
ncbi:hypothetical protein [Spiroplasma cantharicola]|uniref:Uncharacterized protein n=1 Tax=Spiroplasma cantharicola TaxID=362837 RepID=A0A0M4K240_9MOLU|nr:hypothetical protein [Spiroplasma cantharicola]ALD66775.1 hypothetical protein SCANT_v1c08690 [Spiroplasma cantharicola]